MLSVQHYHTINIHFVPLFCYYKELGGDSKKKKSNSFTCNSGVNLQGLVFSTGGHIVLR